MPRAVWAGQTNKKSTIPVMVGAHKQLSLFFCLLMERQADLSVGIPLAGIFTVGEEGHHLPKREGRYRSAYTAIYSRTQGSVLEMRLVANNGRYDCALFRQAELVSMKKKLWKREKSLDEMWRV